jgi:WD40 repeat protein
MTGTNADIKTIFLEALDLPTGSERAAYLDRACDGSGDVRARVEALLAAVGQAGSFLERPALSPEVEDERGADFSTLAFEPGAADAPSRLWDPTTPRRLGDFELVRRLGEGSMGVVFEARQLSLNRPVAIKMIRTGLFAGEADLRRFHIEAEAVAHLDHPRIVPIYGVGEHHDCHYFSMKLISGGSLARHLSLYLAEPRAAARLVAEIAQAIQHAHDRGILHRDLKPSNIMLDEEGRPLVTDFGLAKRFGDDSGLTLSGAIVGTPSYMAPEQASGDKVAVTALTDVYGLGAVLYALLTGRAPFVGETTLETIEQVRERPPAPPSRLNPRVGRDLETICLRCLEKDPRRRYARAQALADDLQRWLDGEPIAARPVSAAARLLMWSRRNKIVAGLLALLFFLALGTTWQWWRAERLLRQALRDASSQAIDRALANCAEGEVGRGMLRLAESLQAAPSSATDLKHAIRANLAAWSRHATQLTNVLPHSDAVHFVAFSPDGRTAVTASPDGTARLWDAFTGSPRSEPLRHHGSVLQAAFSADSRQLVTASTDGTARLWDVASGRPLGTPLRHRGPVRSVAFSPDGRTVLTGGNDLLAQIWDVASQKPLGEPFRHNGWVQQVGFQPDGNTAITACQGDNTVRLWDLRTREAIGAPISYYPGRRHNRATTFFASSLNGELILTTGWWKSGQEECAQVWRACDGQPVGHPLCHVGGIRGIGWSHVRHVAITGGEDSTARLWDARNGNPLCAPLRHQAPVLAVALNIEGTLALSGSEDRTARIWKTSGGHPVGDPLHHSGQVLAVAFRPDGGAVLTGCADGFARLWTLAAAKPAGTRVHDRELNLLAHLARSPDGRTMLTGHADGTAQVRDAATMEPIGPPLRHEHAIRSVAISPDSTRLMTGCVDGTVHIWSTRARERIGRPLHHQGAVHSVAFSPDGRMVLTGSDDGTARLWDAGTGKPIGMPLTHDAGVVAVAFSAAGELLTKTERGTVRRWDPPADASGPDERFVLLAQVTMGAEIDSNGTIRGLSGSAWTEKWNRLGALGGAPQPLSDPDSGSTASTYVGKQKCRTTN